MYPSGKIGRITRSISLHTSISVSDKRASRLKKLPGILPAAENFCRYSTVSGKKPCPGLASKADTAVAKSHISPHLSTTEPSANAANLPLSKIISCPAMFALTVVGICLPMLVKI